MTKPITYLAIVAGGLVSAAIALPPAADAHAMLKTARPGVGSTVALAPRSIEIDFTEGVVPKFSAIAVTSGTGKTVPVGKPARGASEATLVVPVDGRLAPGVYTVTWRAVSVDTHRTQGSFHFTIAP